MTAHDQASNDILSKPESEVAHLFERSNTKAGQNQEGKTNYGQECGSRICSSREPCKCLGNLKEFYGYTRSQDASS